MDILCNCGAPTGKDYFCDNCNMLLTEGITLDIDKIPEELYLALLDEFKRQFSEDRVNEELIKAHFTFVNWKVSADIEAQ